MAKAIDVGGILMIGGLHLFRVIKLVGKAPFLYDVHRLSPRLHRPLLPEEVEGLLKVLGIDVGGPLYEAVRAVGELDECKAEVLGLYVGVVELVGVSIHLIDVIPHHPPQEVDVVDALVHQSPAVLLPSAAPGGSVIVVSPPVPPDMGSTVEETAEAVLLHRLSYFHHRLVEAVLMAGADSHVVFLRLLDDGISILDGEGDGFLDDQVDSGPDTVQGDGGMPAALGADGDEVGLLLLNHRLVVGVSGGLCSVKLELEELILEHLVVDVTETDYLKAICLGRSQVVGRDPPASNEGVAHLLHILTNNGV